jgi:lipopolysaccharide assembly outer membrane protein LptD (OstA)
LRFVGQEHDNRVEYELLAKSFVSSGARGRVRVVFSDASITFHGREGTTMVATAPQAILDETTNTITMLGGVHARTGAGMALVCNQLVYDHASQMLHGSGAVLITDPKGFRATGSSIDSDISLTHTRMQ